MTKTLETRYLTTNKLELRAGEGGSNTLVGYALVYNTLSQDLGGFKERFVPGAFSESLKDSDIRALWNHNSASLLGRQSSKTLTINDTSEGLGFSLELPNTSVGNDVAELIRRGDVTGMSFGFYTIEDNLDKVADSYIRTVTKAELIEISPVTFPAYLTSSVAVRSLNDLLKDHKPEEVKATRDLETAKRQYRLRFGLKD